MISLIERDMTIAGFASTKGIAGAFSLLFLRIVADDERNGAARLGLGLLR